MPSVAPEAVKVRAMGLGEAILGGIVLPVITAVAATLLKRAGKPRQSPEDWALAFEVLVASIMLAATLALRSVSQLVDAPRGSSAASVFEARSIVSGVLMLVLVFGSMALADWLRRRFAQYDVQRLPPGPPTREAVFHLAQADVRSINLMAVAVLVAVYPICALLPEIIA